MGCFPCKTCYGQTTSTTTSVVTTTVCPDYNYCEEFYLGKCVKVSESITSCYGFKKDLSLDELIEMLSYKLTCTPIPTTTTTTTVRPTSTTTSTTTECICPTTTSTTTIKPTTTSTTSTSTSTSTTSSTTVAPSTSTSTSSTSTFSTTSTTTQLTTTTTELPTTTSTTEVPTTSTTTTELPTTTSTTTELPATTSTTTEATTSTTTVFINSVTGFRVEQFQDDNGGSCWLEAFIDLAGPLTQATSFVVSVTSSGYGGIVYMQVGDQSISNANIGSNNCSGAIGACLALELGGDNIIIPAQFSC